MTSLLALCARIGGSPGLRDRLVRRSEAVDWNALPDLAEVHGLAPLLYRHLQAAGIAIPHAARERLLGHCLQHAHAARVRARVLVEVLALYRELGIDVLLLKGAALAHMLYPEPRLRPMRDIDLLVRPDDAERAQAALAEIGFTCPPGPMHGINPTHHHLAGVTRHVEGVTIGVEVHRRLKLRNDLRPTGWFDQFDRRAQGFDIHGTPARTLSAEDMLWHVYRHAFNAMNREPLRLVWLADLVSLVERWLDRIDWDRVRRVYPAIFRILPVLDEVAPLNARVLERLDLAPARTRATGNTLPVFEGWPRLPLHLQGAKGRPRIVADSLFPPARWLRLAYGRGPSRLELWRAWLAHALMLARASRRYAREQAARLLTRAGAPDGLRATESPP